MPRIFAYIIHKAGEIDDSAAELVAAARLIDQTQPVTAIAIGHGNGLDAACMNLSGSFPEVWKVDNAALGYPNAELVRKALTAVIPHRSIVLIPHGHFGVDLAPGLSIKLDAAYVPDVIDIEESDDASLTLIRQEFGGVVNTRVRCEIVSGAVITTRPGAFKAVEIEPANGTVIDKSSEVGPVIAGRRYIETVVAEVGDVDITKFPVLVSVGRGLQEQDNIAIAEELAEALGGAVSCSRPVVDAKWLDKSRQVGSSGKTVQPKVYMACGISGSFQHLAGLKGNPFIVAINKDPKAPIFRVAQVGVVDDVLEFLPALTAAVPNGAVAHR